MESVPSEPQGCARVAVIGANRGLGLAVTRQLVTERVTVLATFRSQPQEGSELMRLARSNQDRLTLQELDLESPESVQAFAKTLRSFRADGLVCNAATASGGLLATTPIDEITRVYQVNFFSYLSIIQSALRGMSRSRHGSIVTVSSVAADRPSPGTLAYGSSKLALTQATRVIAAEMGGLGIRANIVAPGAIDTDMLDLMDPSAREDLLKSSAMARPARPEEVARVIVFLLSAEASFVNGTTITVDGGDTR